MMTEAMPPIKDPVISAMFSAGAHLALSRSRRHPSAAVYIFGAKNRVEIFDLERTKPLLESAKAYMRTLGETGATVLFVGGKPEAREAIENIGKTLSLPYVAGRWIGGTLTNFSQIKSRVDRLLNLTAEREKGELAKYTKRERLVIDKEISDLKRFFSGLIPLKELPKALLIVDPRKEHSAVREAAKAKIPVVALASSDCDLTEVLYPIVGNDSSKKSIGFFVNELAASYQEGRAAKKI